MKGKSFHWTIFSSIFSIVGFFTQVIAIAAGKDMVSIYILAFIYITPLLIDVIEDVAKIEAYNYQQYRLDRTTLIVGIIYFLIVLMLFVLHSSGTSFQLGALYERIVRGILAICPGIFVARSAYAFLIKWNQNANTAKAYFRDSSI